MFWADKVAEEIIASGKFKPYWVDDMFTPSGYPHVGSLRGPLVHDVVYKSLKEKTKDVKWTYIMNDFDPIDGLPEELMDKFSSYMGVPLRSVPSPEEGYESFAEYFSKDIQRVLQDLGVEATYLSSWDMYHDGKFNEVIKIALNNSKKIQDIYEKISGSKKKSTGWLPLQVVCEKCGKLGTTRVHNWDGETVAYTCEPEMVKWAEGCGYSGRISPFDGNGKLPWKVDWPAHWRVLGITIEGAGKDHSSAGGSRDIAKGLCDEVFDIPNPYNLPYEFILIGGKKMSSSKGLGLKARDLASMLPLEIGRFLFIKTDYKKQVEFDPLGTMAIPVLFDEYQKAAVAYFSKGDESLARSFVLSQIGEIKKPPTVRFSMLAQWVQMPNMQEKIKEEGLEEWAKYARIWVEKYAPESEKFVVQKELPESAKALSIQQKEYLTKLSEALNNEWNPEDFQVRLYNITKENGIQSKDAFSAIYTSLIGKNHGPKAAWLILSLDKEFVQKRFNEISSLTTTSENNNESFSSITILNNPTIFSIDKKVREKYPSISIGIAIVKGVHIEKENPDLEAEKNQLLNSFETLTTEKLGEYKEIQAYRKLYKEMRVDWHSRRPSPEALLRRVILKKGLYKINTCVDAYNLIVMKRRISIGAFDLDKIAFPTMIRLPKPDEEIMLLGDDEPTKYKETELAYFDQNGGYNLDFNYRDSQRTSVNEQTKNIYLNVDGIFDITPNEVEASLKEACNIIQKYCGGELEMFGIDKSS